MRAFFRASILSAFAAALWASGAASSVAVDEEEVVFTLPDSSAATVFVVGDFNGWNPTIDRLERVGGGFEIRLFLVPGRYRYRFVVDGAPRSDPGNPFVDADGNSVFVLVERDGKLEVILSDTVTSKAVRRGAAVRGSLGAHARVTEDGATIHTTTRLAGGVDERARVDVAVGATTRQREAGEQASEAALLRGTAAYRFERGVLSAFTRSGRVGLDDAAGLFTEVGPFRYPLGLFCRGFSFAAVLPLKLDLDAVYASRLEGYRSGLEKGASGSGLFSARDAADADLIGGSLGATAGRLGVRYLYRQDRRPRDGSWSIPGAGDDLFRGFERARFQGFSLSLRGDGGIRLDGELLAGRTKLAVAERCRGDGAVCESDDFEREWERGDRFMIGVSRHGESGRLRAALARTTLGGERAMRDGRGPGERTSLEAAAGWRIGSADVDARALAESYSAANTGSVFWLARTNLWLDGDELTCDRIPFLSARELVEWRLLVTVAGDSLRGIPRGTGLRISFLERRSLRSADALVREAGVTKGLRLLDPLALLIDMRAISYRYGMRSRDYVDAYLSLHAALGRSMWCSLGCGVNPCAFDPWLFEISDHGRADYLLERGIFGVLRESGEEAAVRALWDAEDALAEDFMITFEAGYSF